MIKYISCLIRRNKVMKKIAWMKMKKIILRIRNKKNRNILKIMKKIKRHMNNLLTNFQNLKQVMIYLNNIIYRKDKSK
jgi:hypothetical protein